MDYKQEIQEAKQKIGQQSETIIANGLNMEAKGKKYTCTNPENHKHGDKTPAMSWDPNLLQFKCFVCERTIDIYDYYKDHLNYPHREIIAELLDTGDIKATKMETNRSVFEEQLSKLRPISDEGRHYINIRGIIDKTIDFFEIKTTGGKIAFPYFKKETVVGYKLRLPRKIKEGEMKMTSMTGSKPYLFNSKNVKGTSELIICEGEFDCMILWQCGFENVVSVGAGAVSLKTVFDQADDFFKSFNSLIVVGDNDQYGASMDREFIERYGARVKLVDRKLYGEYNDINELYIRTKENGKNSIIDLIESARWKIKGRRDLDKKPYRGLIGKGLNYIPTGINAVDDAINELAPGCTTLIMGRSNGGKTTFVKQIIANAIDFNNKVYVISGEGNEEKLINEIYQCVIGRDSENYNIIKVNRKFHKEPKPHVLKALQAWHKGKLVLFNKGESKLKTTDELFSMLEMEIKINRHDLVIIDNLMSVLTANAKEKLEQQSDFMQRCHDLADTYGTHIILILHPNKTYQKGQDMEFEQISGTADLANKADNVIAIIRNYEQQDIDRGIHGKISVTKNRYYSELPECDLHFDVETGLLAEMIDGLEFNYNFRWKKYLQK